MMIFIIVWDKQVVWLWTRSGICSPTCFEFWLKWEETRIQFFFWIPELCGYFGVPSSLTNGFVFLEELQFKSIDPWIGILLYSALANPLFREESRKMSTFWSTPQNFNIKKFVKSFSIPIFAPILVSIFPDLFTRRFAPIFAKTCALVPIFHQILCLTFQ